MVGCLQTILVDYLWSLKFLLSLARRSPQARTIPHLMDVIVLLLIVVILFGIGGQLHEDSRSWIELVVLNCLPSANTKHVVYVGIHLFWDMYFQIVPSTGTFDTVRQEISGKVRTPLPTLRLLFNWCSRDFPGPTFSWQVDLRSQGTPQRRWCSLLSHAGFRRMRMHLSISWTTTPKLFLWEVTLWLYYLPFSLSIRIDVVVWVSRQRK